MNEENKPGQPAPEGPSEGKTGDSSEAPAAAPKPAAPAGAGEVKEAKPKPAAAKKPPVKKGPSYEDLTDDPLLKDLRERFPDGILSGQTFLGQPIYTVSLNVLTEVMVYLRQSDQWAFDYLVDLTCLDYIGDEKRICMVYHLYSHKSGRLIRIKARAAADEMVPSMAPFWRTADWLEREAYDMFGVEFSGHPDLRRILLPDDWLGYPLRKDYDIKLQDQAWIRNHLRIRKVPE
ncbi:MAG: NADH-quinone oxidoreductase subunit C [Acidobacteria bacterium]|nr:MAG: NADH-quinone oxidoreductase subunit C [Acidobacteriota bacterium]